MLQYQVSGLVKVVVLGLVLCLISCAPALDEAGLYHQTWLPNSEGIGKVYLGRHIAQVMGHQAAYWLERPERDSEEHPQRVIDALDLKPSDTVGDIGAGTGFFSVRLSSQVPQGSILAVDVQPEMIEILKMIKTDNDIPNIQPILSSETDPHLPPASLEVALMVDAYHEFAYPYEMMQAIVQSLKPAGRVVLVEYKKENPLILIKTLHKMSVVQIDREMAVVGLTRVASKPVVPKQHVLVYQKRT